ncbi:MAG: galactokinase [Bacteroidales bacterium]
MALDIISLKKEFIRIYKGNAEEIHLFFAPGRVNLIGEHTDYNGGLVLPFALQFGTYLAVRKTKNKTLKFKSINFPYSAEILLKDEIKPLGREWVNYPLGVISQLEKMKPLNAGLEMLFFGDIPNEAGLSSSASIEMVMAFALNELFDLKLSRIDLIKMSQKAENEFVGMNCGIMDQFAVGIGKKDRAVFLNCDSLDYELVLFDLKDYVIIITNTNKKRGLADSKYNERRQECESALLVLKRELSISHLSDLSVEQFENKKNLIKDKIIQKRTQHVVYENFRVRKAIRALSENNLTGFGKLMISSHNSLRDDYEVSCIELDILVEEALNVPGVLGSRMTGAGFGGCSISLLPKEQVEMFKVHVGKKYFESTNRTADFYEAETGLGIRKIDI